MHTFSLSHSISVRSGVWDFFLRGYVSLPRSTSLQIILSGKLWAHLVRQRGAGAAEAGVKDMVLATEICGDTEVAVGEATPG